MFEQDVTSFVRSHPYLTIATGGLVAIGYLGCRSVSLIYNGVSERISDISRVTINAFNQTRIAAQQQRQGLV